MTYVPFKLVVKPESELAKAGEDELKKPDLTKAEINKLFEEGEAHESINHSGTKRS